MTFYAPPGNHHGHGLAPPCTEQEYYAAAAAAAAAAGGVGVGGAGGGVGAGGGGTGPQPGEWAYLNSVQLDGSFTDPNFSHAVACTIFDPYEEQIWTANRGGHIGAYYGPGLSKYIGVPVQPELRQLVATGAQSQPDASLFVLASDALHLYSKFGLHRHKFHNATMQQLECMHYAAASRHIFVGGQQRELQQLDARTGRPLRSVECAAGSCVILREAQKAMVGGASSGRVSLYDKASLREHMHFDAHSLMVSDLDIQDNLLVTCGWSSRRDGLMFPDRVLRCFDLRSRQAIAPLSVLIDPAFVRFVPGFHDRLLVVSQLGDFLFIDFGNKLPASPYYKVELPLLSNGHFARITDVDVSSSGRSLVFGDDSGLVHLYTLDPADHVVFNRHSARTELPDNLYCVNPNPVAIDSPSFYATNVPFAYPKPSGGLTGSGAGERLLSDWPDQLCAQHYRRSKPFDESLCELVRGHSSSAGGVGGGAVVFRRPSGFGPTEHFPYLTETELCGTYQEELRVEARQYRPKSPVSAASLAAAAAAATAELASKLPLAVEEEQEQPAVDDTAAATAADDEPQEGLSIEEPVEAATKSESDAAGAVADAGNDADVDAGGGDGEVTVISAESVVDSSSSVCGDEEVAAVVEEKLVD